MLDTSSVDTSRTRSTSHTSSHSCMSWRPLARVDPPSRPLRRIRCPKPLECTVPAWSGACGGSRGKGRKMSRQAASCRQKRQRQRRQQQRQQQQHSRRKRCLPTPALPTPLINPSPASILHQLAYLPSSHSRAPRTVQAVRLGLVNGRGLVVVRRIRIRCGQRDARRARLAARARLRDGAQRGGIRQRVGPLLLGGAAQWCEWG